MRTNDQKSGSVLGPLLLASTVALLSFVGAVDLARVVAEMGPQVGDVVAFEAGAAVVVDVDAHLDVGMINHASCRLDVATIRRFGGSLVVEQRTPGNPRSYQVHWAGSRTSPDREDCGATADLVLGNTDLETLAMAAGGYGIDHGRLGRISAWSRGSIQVQ